jgi:hypothetical protein
VERDGVAYAAGRAAAQSDIAAGRLVYRWSGHAGHRGRWIVTQFAEHFDVAVGGGFGICCVTASRVSFNDGYNSIVVAEIDRRHGGGAFQALLHESTAQSEESLWDGKQVCLQRHGLDGEGGR